MDKLREEFEQWASNDRSELDVWQRGHKAGEYKNPVVRLMWKAWQASRESIVVELPKAALTSEFRGDNPEYRMMAFDVKQSIRSIGLSIKGE